MKERDFKRLQRASYSSLAGHFDESQRRENRNHINKIGAISDFLQINEGDKVLEVGVGTGIHAKYLLEWNTVDFFFCGVDISHEMLCEAKARLCGDRRMTLGLTDGEKLAFKNGTFDKVYISGSLHHFYDLEKGLSELLRVLKDGGDFCIMEPNYFFPTNVFAAHARAEEFNMRLIRKGNFYRWLEGREVEFKVLNFAYTPPFPRVMIPLFNVVDRFLAKVPFLKNLSIMLFVRGKKRSPLKSTCGAE